MKSIRRRSFVKAAAGGSALMLAQSSAQQRDGGIPSSTKREFFAVEAAASRHGRSIELGGRPILVKVSGNDTGGEFAVFEVPAAPNVGTPLHIHHVENEWFYVLEGEVDVQVGTEVVRLKAGGSAYLHRMIAHTWQPAAGREVRFLSMAEPAGQVEAFLLDLAELLRKGTPKPSDYKALFERHDMEVVGPPLPSRP